MVAWSVCEEGGVGAVLERSQVALGGDVEAGPRFVVHVPSAGAGRKQGRRAALDRSPP